MIWQKEPIEPHREMTPEELLDAMDVALSREPTPAMFTVVVSPAEFAILRNALKQSNIPVRGGLCARCGKAIDKTPPRHRNHRRYCSDACRANAAYYRRKRREERK